MQKLFYATPAIFISVLLLSLLWLVRKTRTPLIFLILSIGALWLFKYAMREGGIRHDGFTFITIVLVYWLWHQYRTRSSRLDLKIFRSVFILMLIFQAVSSISYHILDNKYVFADGKGVARFIENHQLQSKKILFSPQWGAPPVLWHSQIRDGYFVETQKNQSFVVYSKQAKKQLSQSEVLAAAQQENSQLLIFLDKWETLQPNDTAFLNAGYQLVYLTPNQKILTPMEERYRVYLKQEENQE